jgi:hypothetical protein
MKQYTFNDFMAGRPRPSYSQPQYQNTFPLNVPGRPVMQDDWGWEDEEEEDGCDGDCANCPHYVETFIPKKVIYNGNVTICIWGDDSKTVVKCSDMDYYSEESGVAACIAKKVFDNNRSEFLRVVSAGYYQPDKYIKNYAKNFKKALKTAYNLDTEPE